MRIVFFGTPDFAVPSLKILNNSKHDIVAVVTAPDKPRGRGRKVSVTAIKQFAIDNSIKVLTPEKLNDESFQDELANLLPELFVIVAFRILPENIFSIPSKGAFNLHGSLLPKYRGAAPIQWALINGDTETGLTTFFLEKKVDTGKIILQEKIKIENSDNFESLHDKMSIAGAELVSKTVNLIETGNIALKSQLENLASPAPKIKKETCKINWKKEANSIYNLIRALSPYPGAFFTLSGKNFKVFTSEISNKTNLNPEEVLQSKKEIYIGTTTHAIKILEIQPEGRKRMRVEDFLRGYTLV